MVLDNLDTLPDLSMKQFIWVVCRILGVCTPLKSVMNHVIFTGLEEALDLAHAEDRREGG